MKRIFKLVTFIARLPLSLFCFFLEKRRVLNEPLYSHTTIFLMCLTVIAGLVFSGPQQVEGAVMESMAIDAKGIGLANNVTADPPGILSIYYNPAGLSMMGDGNFVTMGAIPVFLTKKVHFDRDPKFEGFHDYEGNAISDPLAGKESTNTSGRMYIPLLDMVEDNLLAPIFGVSHRSPGSKWTFGYSAYVPFAAGWNRDADDPSRYDGKSIYLQHLVYAGPAVSYRVSDSFSIGASFGLGQTAMGLEIDMRSPNEIVNVTKVLGDATKNMSTPIFDLTIPMPLFGGGMGPYDDIGNLSFNIRDDFSPSFNIGALWQPFDWLAFGIDYQSPIKSHMTGKYSFKYSDKWQNMVRWDGSTAIMQIVSMIFDLPYEAVSEQTGTVTTDMEFPQIVNFGIKVKPVKRLTLLADLHWANWSTTKENNIVFDQPIQLLQFAKFMGYSGGSYNMILKRELDDTLNWGIGFEYQVLDWLLVRGGYENRKTSIQDQYYDLMYPMPTMDYFGGGLGIKWNKINIDLSLGYMTNYHTYKVSDGGSSNLNSQILGAGLNNPYRGLDYDQKLDVYMVAFQATMPLEMMTDMLYSSVDLLKPSKLFSKKSPVKGSLKSVETTKQIDSSSTMINNLRLEDKNYFIEDSE